jgi:type IV secretion system protein VirD4
MDARTALKGVFLAGTAAACMAGGTWLSAASFAAVNERTIFRTAPHVRLTSLGRYWREYGDDPAQRTRLQRCMGVSYGITCALLPAALVVGGMRHRRSLFGDARFANIDEIKAAGLLSGEGLIVGKYRGRYLTFPGQQYVWVVAPPRGGKGRGIAVPNLLNWPDSVIVLDFKEELWKLSAGFRAKHGQRVFRFAPFDPKGCTARFNPLGYVRTDELHRISDLQTIGNIVYPDPGGEGKDSTRFFAEAARNLFLAMGLYLLETPELPRTFGQMLRLASGNGKPFHTYIAELIQARVKHKRPLSADCVAAFNRFLANTAQVFSSILATFTGPLTIFMNPIVDAATSANDFDLDRLRRDLMSVYVCIPFDSVATARLLINLLFTTAINLNTRELPEHNAQLRHQCLLLLDEFPVAGHIDVMARSIGLMPGYNLRVLIICQSESQVAYEYGHDTARTISTAMALQVIFPPKEQADAEKYSKLLDDQTERIVNRNSSTGKGGHSTGRSEQQQRRPLMLPQELKQMGSDRQVIVLERCRPILCGRANYDQDPELRRRSEIDAPEVPPLDLDTHLARINECMRPLMPGEGEKEPLPAQRYAHDFSGMPPLRADATDAERGQFCEGFFDVVRASVVQQVQQAETKPARKKAPAGGTKRARKKAQAYMDDVNFAAAAGQDDDLDLSSLHP